MLALDLLFHLSMHVSQQFKHYFWHIIKGKLGSDMGQPGILTGDTRVSHTHPSVGLVWDTMLSPARIPGCPTSSPSFPLKPAHVYLLPGFFQVAFSSPSHFSSHCLKPDLIIVTKLLLGTARVITGRQMDITRRNQDR